MSVPCIRGRAQRVTRFRPASARRPARPAAPVAASVARAATPRAGSAARLPAGGPGR